MAEVEEITEQVAEQIEEVAEITRRLTGRELGFLVAGSGIGVATGFGVGYFILSKRLNTKYEKLAEQEIAEMREHYSRKLISLEAQEQSRRPLEELIVERGYAQDDKSQYSKEEQQAIEEANRSVQEEEEGPESVVEESDQAVHVVAEEATTVNVFDSNWDYARELAHRMPGVPYIIHLDEFQENALEHSQITVTYYEVDDILADSSHDEVIEDQDAAIGLKNLGNWGHGSNDPNVVYVRNEDLCIDYEIIRDRGSYAETTARSMRHSATNTRRRVSRRFDDDD